MKNKEYYAELNENMRMKIFVIQHMLKDRGYEVSASKVIDLALDHVKDTLDGKGWDHVGIC